MGEPRLSRYFEDGDKPDGKSFFVNTSVRHSTALAEPLEVRKPRTSVKPPKRTYIVANCIASNKIFIAFTTLLTFYALAGDDCRLLFTAKPADPIFDYLVGVCIAVFSFEIVVSCLGKDDYIGGFFFFLDIISTISLCLDFTAVSNLMAQGGADDEGNNNLRSGKTARTGARLGRILRVLRLVRILKLYKNVSDNEKRRSSAYPVMVDLKKPGQDDDWDEADFQNKDDRDKKIAESQVGKRLSELTIRKTILLILSQLLILPELSAEVADQTPVAPDYGANLAMDSFKAYVEHNTAVAPGVDLEEVYNNALLQYIFYHNWFAMADQATYCPIQHTGRSNHCPDMYYGHLFWIGISGKDEAVVVNRAQQGAVNSTAIGTWEQQRRAPGLYNVGVLPHSTKNLLSGSWDVNCDRGDWYTRGVSFLSEGIPGIVDYTVRCPHQDLRPQEFRSYTPTLITDSQFRDWHLIFYFDTRQFSQTSAAYSLLLMAILLLYLVMAALVFTYDANRIIVHPVEKMIKNVMAIREDPLMATKIADNEFKQEEIAKAKLNRSKRAKLQRFFTDPRSLIMGNRKRDEPMETLILEKTIIKLGSLLALGLGEAGANIIKHNMKGANTVTINAMVPGIIVNCSIGVLRVRDFGIATEVLQSKINTFVNMIAEIIHGVADSFLGAPNKNYGDTFLVIWRIEWNEDMTVKMRMAELSLVACSKILGSIHASPLLAGYRHHPGLQYRLGSGCRVNVSCGLHAGWAVEGAVGSEFKIDASYLSPHVSIAATIERATLAYGVSLIVTESVLNICNPRVSAKCRLIDRLRIGGLQSPLKVYCVDLDCRRVQVDKPMPQTFPWNTRNRFKARQFLETEKNQKMHPLADIAKTFDADPTIHAMREPYTVEFFQLFNMGYQNYYQGEWQVAGQILEKTRTMLSDQGDDGPSAALLQFMRVPHGFEPPPKWEGVRELNSQDMQLHPRSASRQLRRPAKPVCSVAPPEC